MEIICKTEEETGLMIYSVKLFRVNKNKKKKVFFHPTYSYQTAWS